MPHLILEYASSLEEHIPKLMTSIYETAVQSQVMNWQDIKIRAIPYHHVLLIKDQQQFVHLCCRLLQGRDDHTKERLSQMLRDALSRQLTDVYSVSVEVVDMHAVSYKKRLLSLPE